MTRRVVITGLGIVCPIGITVSEFWESCLAARTSVSAIPEHWHRYAQYTSTLWAPLPKFDLPSCHITRVEQLQYDQVTLLALCATHQALMQSKLEIARSPDDEKRFFLAEARPEQIGVFMGTGIGGLKSCLENHAHHTLREAKRFLEDERQRFSSPPECASRFEDILLGLEHPTRFHPLVVSMLMPNAPAAAIGIKYSLRGPNKTTTLACASGTAAIGHAFRSIRTGEVNLAVTGGCEYLYDKYGSIFRGFDAAKVLVKNCDLPETCNRPFDEARSGFLFSEGGAAILVLEELSHATRRSAPIVAEITGSAESFDAFNMMTLEPSGKRIEQMIDQALMDACVNSNQIQYINAHGTATEVNDRVESGVLKRKFGTEVLINSTKSLVGHMMGASGAVEAIVTALSLKSQEVHPSKNLDDSIEKLNFVRKATKQELSAALSLSFGFGGHNAAIVLKRFRP